MSQPHVLPGAVFRVLPPELVLDHLLDRDRAPSAQRAPLDGAKSYLLRGVLSPKECRRLIALSEGFGFQPAGLAIGDDTYRRADRVRNNLRVLFDSPSLAAALWPRMQPFLGPAHEGAALHGLNWRFRVYKYEAGHCFRPHYDIRTPLPGGGETRFSVVFYLNEGFDGGETRFFEEKDRASRRGQHRPRKYNNRERFAVRAPVGGAVIFDHLLLHEGGEVLRGIKYAMRTDLIYRP